MNWGRNRLLRAVNLDGPYKLLNFPVQKLPHPPPCVTLFTAAGSCICSPVIALGTAWDLEVYGFHCQSTKSSLQGSNGSWQHQLLGC